jgi:hypothetical protein
MEPKHVTPILTRGSFLLCTSGSSIPWHCPRSPLSTPMHSPSSGRGGATHGPRVVVAGSGGAGGSGAEILQLDVDAPSRRTMRWSLKPPPTSQAPSLWTPLNLSRERKGRRGGASLHRRERVALGELAPAGAGRAGAGGDVGPS